MTSPLPPRRRDTRDQWDLLRQQRTNLRQIDGGLMGGRMPALRPVEPFLEDDEEGDDDFDVDQVQGRNTDAVTATGPGTLTLALTATPVDGTLHVYYDGVNQEPTEWTYWPDSNIVTFPDPGGHIKAGKKLTAAYLYYEDEPEVVPPEEPLSALTLRGTAGTLLSTATDIGLPVDTVIGDLIVVAFGAHNTTAITAPRTATIGADARLAQVSYNTWVGIATNLDPIPIANPTTERVAVTVATFAAPADYKNFGYVAATTSGIGTVVAPVVAATGAVLVATTENRNGSSSITSAPAGYIVAYNVPSLGACNAAIYYWVDGAASASPSGSAGYSSGSNGHAYFTAVGLQEGT